MRRRLAAAAIAVTLTATGCQGDTTTRQACDLLYNVDEHNFRTTIVAAGIETSKSDDRLVRQAGERVLLARSDDELWWWGLGLAQACDDWEARQ